MKSKPIVARERANLDIDAAIDYYLGEDAVQAAMGFIDALERAYAHISRYPATGSSRYAHELNLPGLRSWKLTRYPYLIFYVEFENSVDVWRVLHGQRDIPAWLGTEPGTGGVSQ
ncbi:type II toxin-antitoxin system RelE/ParE family toxin [Variovorax sp. LG9.2]|uniref:type II toxin-antitoxin system RelE/ParE family toxin n=1 Tax=Variovorax sp. LG9.2 TaxID=3048626 RepID=UPI002B2289A8|nr:type II toxin-antitoxin system RelE/ParE family toxin [Variovorax sp. LG9.2]MEB0060191.1 type II toxin-antitoxin system RelE/ParE family toxin [Variovorax sp. LG9.2]